MSAPKQPAHTRLKEWLWKPFGQLKARFWVTFFLACAIVEGAELTVDKLQESAGDPSGMASSLVVATGLYQRIVTSPRTPLVRAVALVEIDSGNDLPGVSAVNVCDERAFLARLLLRIDESSPAVIVIDKYFGRHSCRTDDPGTKALREAIAIIRSHRPLVVGVRARAPESATSGASVIEPSLTLGGPNPTSQEGILNIAADNRRLPLQWNVYEDERSAARGGDPVVRDTLALATVKLYDATLLEQNSRLRRFLARGEQPFIAFLQSGQFLLAHHYASELICNPDAARPDDWRNCQVRSAPPPELRNRIVLVGENSPDADQHSSVIGHVAGFYLQANYIEALLDNRLYASGGPLLDYGFAFLFLFGLEVILAISEHDPVHAVSLIVALLLAAVLLLYLIVLHFGVYIDPLPVGLTAVLIKISHLVYAHVRHTHAHPAKPQ